jgi:hypothetical protein
MTAEELINLGASKVRNTPNLMASYIAIFSDTFGKAPNCAGCTFTKDFNTLKNYVNRETRNPLKSQIMKAKTFKLKKINGTIHTYRVGRKPVRMYDNRMTEAFAIAYLTNGTQEELEARKLLFSVLPNLEKATAEPAPEPTTTEADGLGGGIKNPKPEAPVAPTTTEADGLGGGIKNPKPEAPVAPVAGITEAAESKVGSTTALSRKDLIALLEIAGVEFKGNASNAKLLEIARTNKLV